MNGRREERVVEDDEQNHLENRQNKERKEAENSHDVMKSMKGIFCKKLTLSLNGEAIYNHFIKMSFAHL